MSRSFKKKIDGLTYEQFRRQVKERRIDPLYLFLGEEAYLHDRAIKQLYDTIDESARMFNTASFALNPEKGAGPRISAAQAIDAANQLPMMSERRIVVIRDFDKITDEETEALLDYLRSPTPTATVIFQTTALDQRRKLSAALMKACTVVVFDRLSEQQAARWAEDFLKRRGCRIDPGALGKFIGLVGTRMTRLANEMEKLAAYANGGYIGNETIEQLVPRAREHSTWELWDAILERDRKRAIRLITRLLDDGGEPLMIVGALAGLYRRMLAAKDLMGRGAPVEEVNKATGRYGKNASDFNARVRRTPREEIVYGLRRLAQVDDAIKNSAATPRLQLEYLLTELTLPDSARWGIFL